MKILLISDLHFEENNNWDKINKILNDLIKWINRKMQKNEKIIVITLGDLIHSGQKTAYNQARLFYDALQNRLPTSALRFVPGNHELYCNDLTDFNSFIKEFNQPKFTSEETVHFEDIEGFRFLYVDSTLSRMHDRPGQVNMEEITAKMSTKKNIVFMHFPPCALPDIDKNILNSVELLNTGANYIFYGHQHGFIRFADFTKKDTSIHAVGTLLKEDVNTHDFVFIDIANTRINYIYRFVHNKIKFTPEILLPKKINLSSDRIRTPIPPTQLTSCLKRKVYVRILDSNDNAYRSFETYDLDTYIKDNNLIVLEGDAGSGKSFELQRIYQSYLSDEEYFPIWVCLRNTSSPDLSEYISYCKNVIDHKTPMLICDGLDEIQKESAEKFKTDISSAVSKDIELKVIISVRSALKQHVDGFAKCSLVDIDDSDVKKYANLIGLDAEAFSSAICNSSALAFARKPFYLVEMAKSFAIKNVLSKEDELMQNMIVKRLSDSDKKADGVLLFNESLNENEATILIHFEEIAFFMQVRQEQQLKNINYTEIWELRIRNLLCRTGLFTLAFLANDTAWEFEHNNFREYFVAKYINKLAFDEMIDILTSDKECTKLRPTWTNIVAILLSLQKDAQLVNWLLINAKTELCDLETDKLVTSKRNELFKSIINDAIDQQVPLFSLYLPEKLGRYFQSSESIDFMLEILNASKNNLALSNVLNVLRCCDNFFGRDQRLKVAIVSNPLKNEDYEHIVALSIEVLALLFPYDLINLTSEIFSFVSENKKNQVFGALCDLFIQADVVDEYIDFIVNSLCSDKYYNKNIFHYMHAKKAFMKTKNTKGVSAIINLYCKKDSPYIIDENEEIFSHNCEVAKYLYTQGETHILDVLTDCFVFMANKINKQKCQVIKKIFVSLNVLQQVFENILNSNLKTETMMLAVEEILDETLVSVLINKYLCDNSIDDAVKWYIGRLPYDSSVYKKLDDTIFKKEGNRCLQTPRIDWNKIRKDGFQKYFDSLFDKGLFSALLNELLVYIKNDDITCEQLVGLSTNEAYQYNAVPHERHDLQSIRTGLYHCGNPTQKVTQFLVHTDWDVISISEMCRMLNDYKEHIIISEKQKQYIDNYLNQKFLHINFENCIYNDHLANLISLANSSNFAFDDEILLEMLLLPWGFFYFPSSSADSNALAFVSEKIIDKKKLHDKILYNIQNKQLTLWAKQTHISYCLDKKLPDAINIAISLFNGDDTNDQYRKTVAADYLLKMKGNMYVDNLITNDTDVVMLTYLSYRMKNDNSNLVTKMVEINKKSESKTVLLRELIELNSRHALEVYLELAEKESGIPDLYSNNSRIGEITLAISTINDISLADVVLKLFELSFSENFVDDEFFGIKSALSKIIETFSKIDSGITKDLLTKVRDANPKNAKLTSICNWHLNDLEKQCIIDNDLPWSKEDAVGFLESKRKCKYRL